MLGMRLVSGRVRMFRNIVDSGVITFEPDVTCVVGKNESGKTALLQALHRQNPAPAASLFDEFDDYPRWSYVRDRHDDVISQTEPIECTFELEEADVAAVVAELGPRVLRSKALTRSIAYSGDATISLDVDEAVALTNYLDSAQIPNELRRLIKLGSGPQDVIDGKAFVDVDGNPFVDGDDAKTQAEVDALAHQVALKFQNGSAWTIAKDILKPRLPKFFYFSQYEILPGRIDLSQLYSTNQEPGQSSMQTARALLRLAGAEQDVLTADEFEHRKAELEAISSKLTNEVFQYWTQNENLLVEIDADNAEVKSDPEHTAVVRYLDIRVRDIRHGYTGNFSQRSSGFQWFFSFLAAFTEFQDKGHGVIVLLDEPALNLHGRAQADFLRFINEQLGANSQVIYATHSPFMVEPSRLDRVRILEDKGIDAGSVVGLDVSTAGADSLLPLKTALGHEVVQNLTLGPENELIEGTGDFASLQTIRDHLTSTNGNGKLKFGATEQPVPWWRFWDRAAR
jgi:predicted ATP-dependent endonuclease of OLD family